MFATLLCIRGAPGWALRTDCSNTTRLVSMGASSQASRSYSIGIETLVKICHDWNNLCHLRGSIQRVSNLLWESEGDARNARNFPLHACRHATWAQPTRPTRVKRLLIFEIRGEKWPFPTNIIMTVSWQQPWSRRCRGSALSSSACGGKNGRRILWWRRYRQWYPMGISPVGTKFVMNHSSPSRLARMIAARSGLVQVTPSSSLYGRNEIRWKEYLDNCIGWYDGKGQEIAHCLT